MRPVSPPAAPPPDGAGAPVHGHEADERVSGAVHGPGPARIGSGGSDLEQIDADRRLLLEISVEGFDSPAWRQLVGELHDYARRTLHKFFHTGLLPLRIRHQVDGPNAEKIIRAFIAATEGEHRPLRDEVVAEALSLALSYWRRRVIPERRWDHTQGAQLRTYFVNLALKRLIKVAARELRRLDHTAPGDPETQLEVALAATQRHTAQTDAYDKIDNAHTAAAQLAQLDLTPLEWRIFQLKAAGHTSDEIARTLGLVSAKAVENRVARCRARLAS